MSEKQSDLEYSRQLQEKFELYLLALIFTLLGLAVQTAKFGTSQLADALELLGWLSLLMSGLVGLSRLEWLPVAYKTSSHLFELKAEHRRFVDAAEHGVEEVPVVEQQEPAKIEDLIADRASGIEEVEARIKELENSILRKYTVHKWLFVCGLALLVAARGYSPTVAIFCQHLTMKPTPEIAPVISSANSDAAYRGH